MCIRDRHKTVLKLDEAANALKQIAKSGRRVLFVATKRQAKDIVAEKVAAVGMPYVNERWAGGMLYLSPSGKNEMRPVNYMDAFLVIKRKGDWLQLIQYRCV